MNKKLKLALLLLVLGFIGGLASLPEFLTNYTTHLEHTNKALAETPPFWIASFVYLALQTIPLLVAVTVGTLLYDKVNFKLPVLEGLVDKNKKIDTSGILRYGIIGGLISGVLLTLIFLVFTPILPPDFLVHRGVIKTDFVSRLLNGGIISEIHRFGLMTFLVWLMHKITGKLTPTIYWIAIVVIVLFYGLADLYYDMGYGPITAALVVHNLLLSMVGHTINGWLYWKKGLETAMIAHLLAIVIITIGGYVINI